MPVNGTGVYFLCHQSWRIGVYLDSLGSLVLFLTCVVGPALIAYLVVDDIRQRLFRRVQPRKPEPVAATPAPVSTRRFGLFAWASS
ncbi:hypothetical protein RPD_4334 [Rhodopseudomonas palustris BisB5]|uniref:Uncharacterized protein n=1 Tax=Rhodopseudomonas palustris (strain BisB5) TaxID=316057 RepID=Q130D8_RHOPS|nr:hypothetical protein RPD_4334 [Rhodopseudomonas palustris BisB5]